MSFTDTDRFFDYDSTIITQIWQVNVHVVEHGSKLYYDCINGLLKGE